MGEQCLCGMQGIGVNNRMTPYPKYRVLLFSPLFYDRSPMATNTLEVVACPEDMQWTFPDFFKKCDVFFGSNKIP